MHASMHEGQLGVCDSWRMRTSKKAGGVTALLDVGEVHKRVCRVRQHGRRQGIIGSPLGAVASAMQDVDDDLLHEVVQQHYEALASDALHKHHKCAKSVRACADTHRMCFPRKQ